MKDKCALCGRPAKTCYMCIPSETCTSVLTTILTLELCCCRFLIALLRNYLGEVCGSHILCPRCYQRHSHQAIVQAQKPETPVSPTRHLKKQSSGVPGGWPGSTVPGLAPLDIIAADTRYSGQQVSASGRTVLSPMGASPDNLMMELSRRGSAPK